jgi:hypothetical protein
MIIPNEKIHTMTRTIYNAELFVISIDKEEICNPIIKKKE